MDVKNDRVRAFGKYLLDEEIATGGMSRVFLGRLRGLGGFEKRLLVKQVLPELARDPRFVAMFVQEAKTLVQMSHPHIAPVYELGVVDGVYFLAMEYVEGATLSEILRDGPLAPALVAHLGAQISDALDYAHTRFGIVHRDVTPRNVIVDANGHSRLLDFGIAAPAEGSARAEIFGTPGYLSPEQLAGEEVGPASDVFSLGAVLFEALTGERAFDSSSIDAMRAALERDPPSLHDRGVPADLAAVAERAIARDRATRFTNARDLGRALRGWLASHAPQGIGPELGLRAEQADRARTRRVEPSDASDAPKPTGEVVRTLATSPLLRDLLEPSDDAARATDPPSGGTVPIAGRASRVNTPTPTRSAPRRRRDWLVAATVVAVAGVAGWEVASDDVVRSTAELHATVREPAPPRAHVTRDHATTRAEREVAEVSLVAPDVAPSRVAPNERRATSERTPSDAASRPEITIQAIPWADVTLDGAPLGTTPLRRIAVRAGSHTVELSCPPLGHRVQARFDAARGGTLRVTADLSTDPPTVHVR